MILVRSPLRITLGGGGTDLPSYASVHGGFTVSAAITKYVYVAVVNPFTPGVYLKTNVIENVAHARDLTHTLIRRCLEETGVDRVAITTFADVPAGTGLGSSSALTTALLEALHAYANHPLPTKNLASLACRIDTEGGKQDQYTSTYGGVNAYTFHPDGNVRISPLGAGPPNLLLFYTNLSRSTITQPLAPDTSVLHKVKTVGFAAMDALETGDLDAFSTLLTEQWRLKLLWNPEGVPEAIRTLHAAGIGAGPGIGGKLIGGGGGGFLMFYAPPDVKEALRATMTRLGCIEMPFGFDFEGTKVVTA
jgi:D-glycero-alpha-D-manno-heptose-7-phosphate kinase